MHHRCKLVGSAKHPTVDKNTYRFAPTQPAGGFEILSFEFAEIIMSRTCLVLHISHQRLLIDEAGSQALGIGQFATAIATDVDNKSATKQEIRQYLIEVTLSYRIGKRLIAHIADIVVEHPIFHEIG